jgi:hypothetical protein
MKFFLNVETKSYLRGLENEFGESSNAIRVELNRFEEAGLLISSTEGNKKIYQANQKNSVFNDIHNLLIKFVGIDEIIEKVLRRVGYLNSAYITGDFARGVDNNVIDLLLVGIDLNRSYIIGLIEKAEKLIKKRIRLLIITPAELTEFLKSNNHLLIWNGETSV